GLVQPRLAAAAKAYAWTGSHLNSLRFGENQLSGSYSETQSFRITNKSSAAVSYDLRSTLSSPGYGAEITISPRTVTVPAGATRTVAVRVHLPSSAVARLPGAVANDGGALTSLHGLVVAQPRVLRKGIYPLRMAFLFVPVPLSDIRTTSSLTAPASGALPPITLRNAGVHAGTADLYAWLLSDPAGDATEAETADLTNLGVQSLPGPVGALPKSDRLLVFAASQASGTSTQASHEIDLLLDTDRDGTVDYVVLAADMGLATIGIPNGTMAAFTLNARTGATLDAWPAPAPANGSTVLLPVAASRIGVGATSGPIDVQAAGGTVVGQADPDLTSVARFSAYSPVVSQGDGVILKPGARASVRVTLDAKQLAQQSHLGWLVVTVDGKAGLHEADRVRLVTPDVVADPAAFTTRLTADLTRPATTASKPAAAASR
ncbi:MAG: hypothetical protein ACJ72K_14675, partial [Friedmanniella sp.]